MKHDLKLISKGARGNLIVQNGEDSIVTLKYEDWYSRRASAALNKNQIEIRSLSAWNKTFEIWKDQETVGAITFNWNGYVLIEFKGHDTKAHRVTLKSKGFWKQRYEIRDENEKLLLSIKPKITWRKFKYDYFVDDVAETLDPLSLIELLIYCGYSINHYQMMMSSAVAVVAMG